LHTGYRQVVHNLTSCDLVETMRRIEASAAAARLALATGEAKNGASALERIHNEARDVLRRLEERELEQDA